MFYFQLHLLIYPGMDLRGRGLGALAEDIPLKGPRNINSGQGLYLWMSFFPIFSNGPPYKNSWIHPWIYLILYYNVLSLFLQNLWPEAIFSGVIEIKIFQTIFYILNIELNFSVPFELFSNSLEGCKDKSCLECLMKFLCIILKCWAQIDQFN